MYIGAEILPTRQRCKQADSVSHLKILGEVYTTLHYGNQKLRLNVWWLRIWMQDVLAGAPFNKRNGTYTREEHDRVYFRDGFSYYYGNDASSRLSSARTAQALREVHNYAVEKPLDPRTPVLLQAYTGSKGSIWVEAQVTASTDGVVRVRSLSSEPVVLKKNEMSVRITPLVDPEELEKCDRKSLQRKKKSVAVMNHEEQIEIDPFNCLPARIKWGFKDVKFQFKTSFPLNSMCIRCPRGV